MSEKNGVPVVMDCKASVLNFSLEGQCLIFVFGKTHCGSTRSFVLP